MAIITPVSTTPDQANAHVAGAGLYTVVNQKVQLTVLNQSLQCEYPVAMPTNPINILQDFPWSNSASDTTEVPSIWAQEFRLTWGQTMTNLQNIIKGGGQLLSGTSAGAGIITTDPYLTMYSAEPTGFNYCFPHLIKGGQNMREISNSWGAKDEFTITGSIGKFLDKTTKNLTDLIGGVVGGVLPGFGLEETEKFGKTTNQTITISFPLYNTKDTKTAFKNYCFCLLFAFQNLKTRTTFMTYIPPKLYTLSNLYNGGIYMPVAIVESFSIDSIGTTRVLYDQWSDGLTNSPILIPEAYKVTIKFREIISPSSNIMLGSMGGNKIQTMVMNNNAIEDMSAAAQNTAKDLLNIFKPTP